MNTKKIFIFIILLLLILGVIFGVIFIYNNAKATTLTSADNSFKITVPGNVKFKQQIQENTDYSLDIYSVKDEMFFNSTVVAKQKEIDLLEAINKEKADVPNIRSNVRNATNTTEVTIKDVTAYQYSYIYYDDVYKKDLYVQVVWIQTARNIYVLDFEVITQNQDKYIPIFNKMISSFQEQS